MKGAQPSERSTIVSPRSLATWASTVRSMPFTTWMARRSGGKPRASGSASGSGLLGFAIATGGGLRPASAGTEGVGGRSQQTNSAQEASSQRDERVITSLVYELLGSAANFQRRTGALTVA